MSESTEEPFPLLPITSDDTLRKCASLELRPRDVFVASYPKSGTTWMQHIVHTLATDGNSPLPHVSDACPFFEVDRTWDAASDGLTASAVANHKKIDRRIFNTHLRWAMMPKSSKEARYVYMIRRPVDACVSFFHHLSHQAEEDGGYRGSLAEFIAEWTAGTMFFGSWSAHLRSWLPAAASDERILLVSYEALRADPRTEIGKINAHCGFGLSDARLDELLPRFSFKWMRENEAAFEPRSVRWVQPAQAAQAAQADSSDERVGGKRARDAAASADAGNDKEARGDDDAAAAASADDGKVFHFIRAGRVGDGDAAFGPTELRSLRAMVERTYGKEEPPPPEVAALLPKW